MPLLLFRDFSPDWKQVQRVFEQVAGWVAEDSESESGEVETLDRIVDDRSFLKRAADGWYRADGLTRIAAEQGIERDLLASVVGATLKPFLFAYSRVLLPQLDQETWRRGCCPICGGKPDFAYLDEESGARWLLCSRCDSEWLFGRLECPYCGTQDQDALAYFIGEDESNPYRLYVCNQCCTYIKTIDLRKAESDVLLPLQRVVTVDMDRQGQEKGYEPGWVVPRGSGAHA
jgi:FdhE protein